MSRFFPTLMIFLSVGAALMYAYEDITNWRMIGYWTAAAALNFCVTY
jgi:hypothetical protein